MDRLVRMVSAAAFGFAAVVLLGLAISPVGRTIAGGPGGEKVSPTAQRLEDALRSAGGLLTGRETRTASPTSDWAPPEEIAGSLPLTERRSSVKGSPAEQAKTAKPMEWRSPEEIAGPKPEQQAPAPAPR